MARIRSIKPDFFTSEVIGSLSLSAKLTFIGLWTHVDDNGVTVDNPKLISAAIWPLEDDPRETLQRTSGDLASLSAAGLIVRYEVSGKRYLFVRTWDEHQKVSHPSKPRYPRPKPGGTPTLSSENAGANESSGGSPEDLLSPPEILAPEKGYREQGAGSREQGVGDRASGPAHTRVPEDFLTKERRAWAKENMPAADPVTQTISFVSFWAEKANNGDRGALKTPENWDLAWRKWMAAARPADVAASASVNSRTPHTPFRENEDHRYDAEYWSKGL